MHVLQLLPYLSPNGTEKHALLLSRHLVSGGHQVTVVAPPGPMQAEFEASGVAVRILPQLTLWSFARAMRLAASWARECDVAHAHAAQEFGWGLRGAGYGGPIVFTAHCYHDDIDYKKAGLFLNGSVQRVIAVSGAERDRLSRGGVRRLETVLNGIDREPVAAGDRQEARRSVRAEFGLGDGQILAIAVGRLERPKGLTTLLDALARTGPEVFALLAGEGPMRRSLEALACRLGLTGRVAFVGRRSDIGRLLAGADLYVSASRREGLSLAALEALAAGLPLVVTDIPEFAEIAQLGVNAQVFRPGDAPALARALLALAGDPDRRRAMAEASRELAPAFSFEQMGERTLAVYRSAIADRSGSSGAPSS